MADDSGTNLYITGIVLYSLTLLIVIGSAVYLYFKCFTRNKWKAIFHTLVIAFLIMRIGWYITLLLEQNDTLADLLLNRVALLLFFSSFSLVFFWQIEDHNTMFKDVYKLPWKYLIMYIVVNAVIYIYELITGCIYAYDYHENPDMDRESNLVYDVEIYTILFYNLILGVLFGIVGFLKFKKIQYSEDPTNFKEKIIIILFTLLFVSCYLIRVAIWSLRVAFGVTISLIAFEMFGYWVPEILPIIMQLFIILRELSKGRQAELFSETLYEQMTDNEGATLLYDKPNLLTYQTRTHDGGVQRIHVPLYSTDTDDEPW